jgi:hypothetical protein
MGTPRQHKMAMEAKEISAAIQYVIDHQGNTMSMFEQNSSSEAIE